MASSTRAAIRQEAHDRLYAANRRFRRLRNGPDATGLTEFTTGATTVVDTALQETASLPVEFHGAWIRLKYVDNSSVTQERVSRIHQFDPSSGTLTYSPAIGTVHGTAGTVNGEYEIWPDVHPDEADNAAQVRYLNQPVPVFDHVAEKPRCHIARSARHIVAVPVGVQAAITAVFVWIPVAGTARQHTQCSFEHVHQRLRLLHELLEVARSAGDGIVENEVLLPIEGL